MGVTNYTPSKCRYILDKLDNVVYLIGEDAVKDIHVDNGEAYIGNITEIPMSLKAYNVQLTETEELNERYTFSHTLQFSVYGYANKQSLDGKYVALVKSKDDGGVWLMNPEFPSKVTYTYTLNASGSHTDFTLSTISNIPMLRVVDFAGADAPSTCGYEHTKIDTLRLNETKYSMLDGNDILYTNDGFKYVRFAKDSCVFTETFDGKNVSHKLTFNIPFSIYKSSWHYNLLEFPNNKYATIITTTDGKKVLCGFGFGLQPSYTVNANDEDTVDNIEIVLQDLHDNGNLITIFDDIVLDGDGNTTWRYIKSYSGYNAYECLGLYEGQYLLQQEVDILGNPTGRYKCLQGQEYRFQDLNIIGTLDETETFACMECTNFCILTTTLPSTINFNHADTQTFTLDSDSDWSISSNTAYITVSPLSGAGGSSTTLTVTNTATPTATAQTSQLGIVWCNEDKKKIVNVVVVASQSCFPQGKDYAINRQAQTLQVPTTCCISSAEDLSGNTSYIQVNNNSISLTYGENSDSASSRSSLIKVTFCDGNVDYLNVVQDKTYVEWKAIGRRCDAGCYCEYEQLYSGTSSSAITTPIERYRKIDSTCTFSYACGDVMEQWIPIAMRWYCMDGHTYKVEKKQIKKLCNTGPTILWEDTCERRLGDEVASPCPSGVAYDYRWNLTDCEGCNGTNKYKLYQLERSSDSGSTWEDVVPSQFTFDAAGTENPILVEEDSLECGYMPMAEYRTISGTPYCSGETGFDKYVDTTTQMSYDSGTTWQTVYTSTTLVEADSPDCGYVEPQYRTLTTATTCVGVDKHVLEEYQVSYDSGATWTTTATSATTLIEANAYDCGYRTRTTSGTPYCSGASGYDKYVDIYDQVSTDYGVTWTTTATTPTLIEVNSEDCGYVPPIIEEWRVITPVSGDPSTYICDDCGTPQERTTSGTPYCSGATGFDKYVDVYSQISYDSGSTWITTATTPTLVEVNSSYCGYVPPTPTVSGDYLTFSIQTDGTFSLLNEYDENIQIEYSKNDGAWASEYVNADISVRSGDVVKLRGNITPQQITSRLQGGIGTFTSTCEFAASGNPLSLVVGDNFSGVTSLESYPFAFAYLFHSCSGLKDINGIQLPFATLSDNCYRAMFTSIGITALTTNILSAATAVTSNCYYNMFVECHSLESVPSGLLPHTTLAYNCYNAMFFYCDSLQIAPQLPATTLVERCYMNMFFNCSNLNYVECHATDISASNCTQDWLMFADWEGTFVTPSSTNWSSGYSGIPNNWTRVDL